MRALVDVVEGTVRDTEDVHPAFEASPATAARIVSNTATSARFTMLVTIVSGISSYWSASTPIAMRPASCAASKTPCPVEPDAW